MRQSPGRGVLSGLSITLVVALFAFWSAVRPQHIAAQAALLPETDVLGIPYASRLSSGTTASGRSRLFDDPNDRDAQVAAVREDDAYARDGSGFVVGEAENRALYASCVGGAAAPATIAVRCSGRNGYILHLALRGEGGASVERSALDQFGPRWAAIFARFHPQNRHCALVVLAAGATAEDEADNDDAGNAIIRTRCYPSSAGV